MIPLIEYTIQDTIMEKFRIWCDENGREPKYFVIHPNDYYPIHREFIGASATTINYNIIGTPILVSDIVPEGQFEFVG